VVFGATVDLEDEDSGPKVTYQIVGDDEADLKLGLINISSPIARALIGKEEGDSAEVQAPGGVKHYDRSSGGSLRLWHGLGTLLVFTQWVGALVVSWVLVSRLCETPARCPA
jgi:hypothetical protein